MDCKTCGKPIIGDVHISGDCMSCRQLHDYVPELPLFCSACEKWTVNAWGCFNEACAEYSTRAGDENKRSTD
jgi:hypothetical protein